MPAHILEVPPTYWECPNCNARDVTRQFGPHTRMHTCPGVKGLTAPMVREGDRAQVVARVREDYIGKDVATLDDDGRPIMSIETIREDGSNDIAAFAGCAVTSAEARM